MEALKRITLALVIIGAINWGLIGFFQFDLVATIFGGQGAALSRVVYALVGLSGLYCLTMLFAPMGDTESSDMMSYGTEFGKETDLFDEDENDNSSL